MEKMGCKWYGAIDFPETFLPPLGFDEVSVDLLEEYSDQCGRGNPDILKVCFKKSLYNRDDGTRG